MNCFQRKLCSIKLNLILFFKGGLAATGTAAFAYDQVQQRKHAVEAVEMERKLQVRQKIY